MARKVTSSKVTIELRPAQMEVFQCSKRFRVLAAGRRFGKTHLALVEMLRVASGGRTTVWYVAPSLRQAKQIAWERLKELSQPFWRGRPNESELSIRTRSGAVMALRGADRYDSLRGSGLDFVVLDEYASMKPECWTEVLRPALADKRGGALFIGTPQGSNHLAERFEQAQGDPEWGAFQFTTLEGGNVSSEELASAARELDQRLFRQEFEASFDSGAKGRAYHAFSRLENVRRCEFRPGEPLIWALDFNVDPLCAVLAQCAGHDIQVLQEMVLAEATTAQACEELLARTREWRRLGTIFVEIYGDASGFQRRTCGPETDWSTVTEFFKGWRGEFKATMRVPKQNPAVRERVSALNAKLLNAAGERRLFVDPQCKELIRDLESVRWKVDASGSVTRELDKSSKMRTHLSDALGYYVAEKFGMRGTVGLRDCGRLV